jgi:hypothetical protein
MPIASSTIADPRILAIDRNRAHNDLSHRQLCEFSGVHPTHWHDLRRGALQPTDRTVQRLEKASRRRRARCLPATLADFFWTIAGLFGEAYGLSPEDVFSGSWGPGVRSNCRRLAMYVMTVELLVSNADLARAIGQTRQNIKQARDIVETRRDDPAIDALLERVARRVSWQWSLRLDGGYIKD